MSRRVRAELDAQWLAAAEHGDGVLLARLMLDDFEGFCSFIAWITDRRNRPIRPEMNRCQRVALAMIERQISAGRPVRQIWLKCRQVGFSTLVAMYMAWRTFVHRQNSLIALHRETPGRSVFSKVETIYKKAPVGLLPPTTNTDVGTLMRFEDAVIRRDSAENIEIGVGETFQHFQLSELPRWKDAESSLADLIPAIPNSPDTSIFMEFTAKGAGDYANQAWNDAVAGIGGYEAGFFPWYWHTEEYAEDLTEFDEPLLAETVEMGEWIARVGVPYPLDDEGEWIADQVRGVVLSAEQLKWWDRAFIEFKRNRDKMREQYPGTADEAWVAGSGLVVTSSVTDRVATNVFDPVRRGEWVAREVAGVRRGVFQDRADGDFWIWDLPRSDGFFILAADASSGTSNDPCCVEVLDANRLPGRLLQSAQFIGLLVPHELAKLLYRAGHAYGQDVVRAGRVVRVPALVAVERNFHGSHVIDALLRMGYPSSRIYRHFQEGTYDPKQTAKYGWPTTWTSKIPMVEDFASSLYDDSFVVRSSRTLGEIRSFVWNDGRDKAAAISGAHDDSFMACSVGNGVWRKQPKRVLGLGKRPEVGISERREAGAGMPMPDPANREKMRDALVSNVTGY